MNNWLDWNNSFLRRKCSQPSQFHLIFYFNMRLCGAKQPTLFIINYSLFIKWQFLIGWGIAVRQRLSKSDAKIT